MALLQQGRRSQVVAELQEPAGSRHDTGTCMTGPEGQCYPNRLVHNTNVRLCESFSSFDCGSALQVRQWNIWGLPKDDLSTENAIAIDVGECEEAASLCQG